MKVNNLKTNVHLDGELIALLEEFNKNMFLKTYNKEFKNIAFIINKLKRAE